MQKLNFKLGWFAFIIPIGIVIFVVIPELHTQYRTFQTEKLKHQNQILQLDSLQNLAHPTTKVKNEIKRLSIHVEVGKKIIVKKQYLHYKIGGMVLVLLGMFIGMFGSNLWVRQRKQSKQNKVVEFAFKNFKDDIIGQKVNWQALQNGGSNFLSERLKKTVNGYKISSTGAMKSMAWAFILIGLNYTTWEYVEVYTLTSKPLGIIETGKIFFTSGGPFLLVGLFLARITGAKAVFLMARKILIVDGKKVPFREIYAIQLLKKFVEGNSSGSYYSYELNIVTKKGERHNLLNHGDKMFLLSDTVKISQILKVPVWNAGVD